MENTQHFLLIMEEPANTIVTHFPFVFLPGILVPVAYSMHFLIIKTAVDATCGLDSRSGHYRSRRILIGS